MKIKKAIILAAGFGTRFLPATKASPKEMMPIIDTPVIQYVVEECIQSGLEDITIVTRESKRAIQEHFERNEELEKHLAARGDSARLNQTKAITDMGQSMTYVRQQNAGGVPDAIWAARSHIGGEDFAVLFGDDILIQKTKPHIRQLMDVAERKNASCVGATAVAREDIPKFGIFAGTPLEPDVWKLVGVVEKPSIEKAPSDWASNGRYAFTNDYLELIPDTPIGVKGEKHWPDVALRLMEKQPMYARLFDGTRFSVGDKMEFLKATVEMALMRKDTKEEFGTYLAQLKT